MVQWDWALPSLGVNPDLVVSNGMSSGGFMSSQLQFVFSSRIKGAGIQIAGPYMSGYYYEEFLAAQIAEEDSAGKKAEILSSIISDVKQNAADGKIDPLVNLKDSRTYVELGEIDNLVQKDFSELHQGLYDEVEANLKLTVRPGMGHGPEEGFEKRQLQFLYEDLPGSGVTAADPWKDATSSEGFDFLSDGYLRRFDQQEFIDQAAEEFKAIPGNEDTVIDFNFHWLMKWGWVYYPAACLTESCKFSFVNHGCGDWAFDHVMNWGQAAQNNKLALVFPQTGMCWDNYKPKRNSGTFTNQGFIELFFSKMLDRVLQPVDNAENNTAESMEKDSTTYLTENTTYEKVEGGETGFESKNCYEWYDELGKVVKQCYTDPGYLNRMETMLEEIAEGDSDDDDDGASRVIASVAALSALAYAM